MKKLTYFTFFAIVSVPILAQADLECLSGIKGVTVPGVRVTGPCTIEGAKVEGDIVVKLGGSLDLSDTLVEGNISASKGAQYVRLHGGVRVLGGLSLTQVKHGSGFLGERNRIDGEVEARTNSAHLTLHYAKVGGMTIEDNRGGASIVGISSSSTGGDDDAAVDIQCSGNDPPPFGFGNKIRGKGQCAGEREGRTMKARSADATRSKKD